MPLQISDRVRALGAQAQDALSEQFARIDAIAEYNTQKVLSAFQTHKVAESMFQGTTGYGYDDLGRETLGAIYADLFGAEDAMSYQLCQRNPCNLVCSIRGSAPGGCAGLRHWCPL